MIPSAPGRRLLSADKTPGAVGMPEVSNASPYGHAGK
jgi:hypothetical protein